MNDLPASRTDDPAAGGLLIVDTAAVVANWRTLRDSAPTARACGAVMKADGYGLGAAELAPALAAAGCRDFFVAVPDEGIALRRALPGHSICVLSGPLGSLEPFITHTLTPVLNAPEQVAEWLAHSGGRDYVLQVDSGMNRLGLTAAELTELAPTLQPRLLMSHLCCADEPAHPMNQAQLAAFRVAREKLPGVPSSLAASSGIFLGPDYHFDMVRPGIGLYGGNPVPGQPNPVRAVATLRLRIVQVRRIDTPGAVGYGATHAVSPGMRLATVSAGYADGLLRSLGGRGVGMLGGIRVPIVGRVSMDLISFDVSAVPEDLARPGQWISVLGDGIDLDGQAGNAGTISYELLTGLSRRYARRYTGS